MTTYTVYAPSDIGDPHRRAARTVFVREGFNWPAFVFGPVYLLYRRLWLGTLAWLVVASLLAFLCRTTGLSSWPEAAVFGFLALLTGLETATLHQYSLRWRGHGLVALLTSPTLEQAERAFFEGDVTPSAPGISPAVLASERSSGVIGSFPRAGGS